MVPSSYTPLIIAAVGLIVRIAGHVCRRQMGVHVSDEYPESVPSFSRFSRISSWKPQTPRVAMGLPRLGEPQEFGPYAIEVIDESASPQGRRHADLAGRVRRSIHRSLQLLARRFLHKLE
jgi:hypothetical protein